ncbi:ATP-dependent helicase/deoxyribonuclease subunit B [Paenibacillus radicis (ex Gao et al. 2016)]|uniref:ATP-dependent helicase/deoxyribonuclease subunit B n=1 Tax=Paenibacillus radicis (ex Gao et al. 2016) TaxID=1737354 RepID=A0A917LTM9_9BACL|nr:helicase-exonuclease AddAB subunit AddB [Paenibacillus radicis (ex Gao et al. 2016)]GGG56187.1 ATP-dependent helicase/deoxyribonuclease subunit B [Paenibacillus radicis (ex Gao et al. 2016)]
MALRFVLGRSGSGKTTYCLEEIRDRLRKEPKGSPLIMLVPEQATFQTEYSLLKGSGLDGAVRAQALSFRRLSFRVMQETGGTALVPIGDTGKHMLLYKIVHRLGNELELFQSGAGQPGFIERLGELLTEWKRYGIDADSVGEALSEQGPQLAESSLLRRKLHDLQLVYGQLERELTGLYIDSEDYLTRLTEGYASADAMRGAALWIDGFHGFTPKEYEALGALIASSAEVTVALTLNRAYAEGEKPHELELFHPTAETYGKLLELASQAGVEVLEPVVLGESSVHTRYADSPMMAHLERHYGTRVPMLLPDPSLLEAENPACGLSLHAAANRRAEVEAVARDIVRRAREEGLRWRDMAVMVRNAADYNDYIESAFRDYEIPYFLDQKESAVHHPLVEFIRSALETVLHGWHYEAVFRCIKTELLFPIEGSMPREQFDLLENYVLAAGIDGWKWQDRKRWRPIMVQSLEEETIAEPSARATRELEAVLEAREAIVPPLRRFGNALKQAADVRAMCEALYRLLDHSDAADRLERWSRQDAAAGRTQRARAHRQLWDGVMQLLDQLVEMAGSEAISPEIFAGMVETGLESLKLSAVPPAIDQTLVGSMDRTRSGDVKVCYVLGANDGVMPKRIQEDGILTEQERERLADEGLTMAPGVRRRLLDERFIIYNALTTPSSHLWISWAQADEEGKSLLPSEVIRQVKQLFPGIPVSEANGEPTPGMAEKEQRSYIAHPNRTLSHLITELRAWRQGAEIAPFWWDLYNWYAIRPQWQDKLSLLAASLGFSNQEEALTVDTARQLYGEHLKASVSRMERFVSCPFQHFAIHGLKLRERQQYRLEAPDMGQLFHAALSRLAGGLGTRFGSMAESDIRAEAAKTVDELAPRLQSQILLSSGRFQYIARKLKEIVAQAAVMLSEHARRAQFQPVGLEVDFGPEGTLPSLVIPLADGRSMEIIGRIDRVDAAETEQGLLLRVLDYKSSATQLRLEEVAHGLSLQMLTYLDVLITHASEWLGQPASPAGVLYFHVHNPLLAVSNGISGAEVNAKLLKRFKLRGLVTAEAETVRLMDDQLDTGYSELLPVALKRDGGFYSSSSVVTDGQWDVLRSSVRRTIARIGTDIGCGKVSIEPYRLGTKSPCQYCDYKPVCHFDPLFDGNSYVKLSKPVGEDVWRQLEGEEDEHGDNQ